MIEIAASEHRAAVIAAYRETRSIRLAAVAAGVGRTRAYLWLIDAGEITRQPQPRYPAAARRLALELYGAGWSCERAAGALAAKGWHVPEKRIERWVHQAGRMRTKSQAQQLREGRDMRSLQARAIELLATGRHSLREITRMLGVARSTVQRWLGPDVRTEAQSAIVGRLAHPNAASRSVAVDVLRLRTTGATYREIRERTGLSFSTISKCLKAA